MEVYNSSIYDLLHSKGRGTYSPEGDLDLYFSYQEKLIYANLQVKSSLIPQNNLLLNEYLPWTINAYAIGVDWIAGNIYYVDANKKSISVTDASQNYRLTLFWGNLNNIQEIAIDSEQR